MSARELQAGWTEGLATIELHDLASVSLVRQAVRTAAQEAGLDTVAAECVVTAASELAHNVLAHGRAGHVGVGGVAHGAAPGVEVVAADVGPGIRDVAAALAGTSPSRTLGVGLSSVRRLVDELDVDVRRGEGSCLRARKYARPPLAPSEIGVAGRPHPAARVCGDDACAVRRADGLLCAVADGLGHGAEARAAAALAIAEVRRAGAAGLDLRALLAAADRALVRTRGAVMGLARLDRVRGELEVAGAGNVMLRVLPVSGPTRRFEGTPMVLGSGRRPARAPRSETLALVPGDLVVLASDGLRTGLELGEPGVRLAHPAVVAAHLLAEFARDHDDALVLVAS
ncbi:MAG: SpoIIE family protein phosphatase [Polyangiaceae bacterium]|nr:SpoIIE family protein phosphatase [Polyangiaceae bacterium]